MSMSRGGVLAAAAAAPVLMRAEDATAPDIARCRGATLMTAVDPGPPVSPIGVHAGFDNAVPTA